MPRLADLRDILDHLDDVLKQARSVEGVFRSVSEADTFGQRLTQLRAALEKAATAEPSFALIAAAAFPGLEGESLRVSYSRFAALLSQITKKSGVRFALVKPSGRNRTPSELICHFEGDSLSDHRLSHATSLDIESVSREGVAASGPVTYIPMSAWPDVPLVFVSFAVAETDLVDRFMRQLIANLPPRCRHRVKFWRFDEVTAESGIRPGEENEAEIRKAMDKCQFGLLLISPTYIGRPFINRVELPHFIDPDAKAPCVPVALADWIPGEDKDVRLDPKNVFSLKGKPYNQLRSAKQKADFTKELAERIEAFIDHHKAEAGAAEPKEAIAPPPPSAFEKAWRDALDLVPDDYEEQAKEWRSLHGRLETQLGKPPSATSDIPDDASRDGAVDLMTRLTAWATSGDGTPAYLALLGETGAGKTMSCLEFTRRLLADGKADPLVIYLDLRRANEDGLIKSNERPLLAEIIEAIRRRTGSGHHASVDELLRAVRERRAILIWDGLDEVLVHLSHEAGQAFFRQLLEALPPRLANLPGAGRLVFACRTQYFRDLHHEADLFTGGQKEGIPTDGKPQQGKPSRARFEVLRVLPFSEEQIRGYLAANMPGLDVDRAFEVINTVHNLRELAGRPYLLSLMRESLADFDTELAAGHRVRSVDLYERLVHRWLEREKTREVIGRPHKRRLMQRLAAHFWREGIRSMPVEDLDAWLEKLVVTDPLFTAAMGQQWQSGSDARDALCEHLRAATFLGRWDGGAFRFAHTSLLEYFLACHLCEALEEGHLDEWDLPRPSLETIGFLVERAAVRREANPAASKRMDLTLSLLLGERQPNRSKNALGFYVRSHEAGESIIPPKKIVARGLDLTGWHFAGSKSSPLHLPQADFTGSTLIRAVFHFGQLADSQFAEADLRGAEFIDCELENSDFSGSQMVGVRLRSCSLTGTNVAGTDLRGLRIESPAWDRGTETRWRNVWAKNYTVDVPPKYLSWIGDKSASNLAMVELRPSFLSKIAANWSLGHNNPVTSIAFSPDHRRILSGSWDTRISIWDTETGANLRTLFGHSNWVTCVAFSPNGLHILSGSWDKTVRLWSAETGECLSIIPSHSLPVTCVAFSKCGERIISGSEDTRVHIWEVRTGECLRTFEGHSNAVTCVDFSPDGRRILTGSPDGRIKVWNQDNGHCLCTISVESNWASSAVFSPDGLKIIGSNGDNLCLWDADTGICLKKFSGHSNWVTSTAISADGKFLLSGSDDATIKIWGMRLKNSLCTFTGHSGKITSVQFSPDGRLIVSASEDRTIRLWDVETGCCLWKVEHPSRVPSDFYCSSNGNQILLVSGEEPSGFLDLSTGSIRKPLEGDMIFPTKNVVEKDSNPVRRSPFGTLLQTLPDGTERDIAALPDGGYCVLEKKPGGQWRIARANGDYWRYVNYASDTRPDGTPGRVLYSADLFPPVIIDD